jgi:hypothetical protein
MASRIPFTYGEFYDVPRIIRFQFCGRWYFPRSPFVDERDDYDETYDVYLLPHRSAAQIEADPLYWTELSGATHLGRLPIATVGLDETRRQTLDGSAMESWLSGRTPEL